AVELIDARIDAFDRDAEMLQRICEIVGRAGPCSGMARLAEYAGDRHALEAPCAAVGGRSTLVRSHLEQSHAVTCISITRVSTHAQVAKQQPVTSPDAGCRESAHQRCINGAAVRVFAPTTE